jgi:alpha-ketoglutaric semialdehyde dehydrogenase
MFGARSTNLVIIACRIGRRMQGLAAAVFTTSLKRIEDFLQRVRAGILKINCSTANAAVDLPFGGWKASGIGPAEHGPANREFFTRMQAIYFA